MKKIKVFITNILIKTKILKRVPLEKPYLYSSVYPYQALDKLSNCELLSLMRHEAHRIEKSIYNTIFLKHYKMYLLKAKRLDYIFFIFEKRNKFSTENSLIWAKQIRSSFDNLYCEFILPNSLEAKEFDFTKLEDFSKKVSSRRSIRVWKQEQLESAKWLEIAYTLIDIAKWTPSSGNRQPWRFKILIDKEDKKLLSKLKEEHCVNAPLLIFIGMDSRVYGSLSNANYETALFIDAGAAIMNMIAGANESGLGTCWNHFGRDLIISRSLNRLVYDKFCKVLNIEKYIEPVAILAVGLPKFIPPTPARTDLKNLII